MRNKKNIRTCLGCYNKKNKKELFRIVNIRINNDRVKKQSNNIIFDKQQQLGGRGAYICSINCLDKAILKQILQKRLKSKISINQIQEIKKAINERVAVEK